MNSIKLTNYNLHTTLLGGQSFAWDYIDGFYFGCTRTRVVKLKQDNDKLFWQTYPQRDDYDFLKTYLQLDLDYDNVLKKIQKDQFVKTAISHNPNVRLLRQDLFETLIGFIISTNKNIPSIRKSIRSINQKFGKKLKVDGKTFYLFPEPEILASANLEDLLETKVGFRAKYILSTTKRFVEGNLGKLEKEKNISKVRQELLMLNGVGEKVADCTMLFALGFNEITPLDVWAKRVLTNLYELDEKLSYDKMREWVKEYFEGYAGFAGQFLFEYYRKEYKNLHQP